MRRSATIYAPGRTATPSAIRYRRSCSRSYYSPTSLRCFITQAAVSCPRLTRQPPKTGWCVGPRQARGCRRRAGVPQASQACPPALATLASAAQRRSRSPRAGICTSPRPHHAPRRRVWVLRTRACYLNANYLFASWPPYGRYARSRMHQAGVHAGRGGVRAPFASSRLCERTLNWTIALSVESGLWCTSVGGAPRATVTRVPRCIHA